LAKSCCFEPPLKLVEILARKMGLPTEVQQAKKIHGQSANRQQLLRALKVVDFARARSHRTARVMATTAPPAESIASVRARFDDSRFLTPSSRARRRASA